MNRRLAPLGALAVATLALTSACVDNAAPSADGSSSGGPTAITVDSSADACDVSTAEAPSGSIVFTVSNSGDDITEFYLLAEDGLRIISEVENVGPGLTRDLVVQVQPGTYVTACKPGMVGDGIRNAFTVTDSGQEVGPTGERGEQLTAAAEQYVFYVKDQTEQLLALTETWVAAYKAGDDDTARATYATARVPWERVEPVAESFGDLDPMMDAREADLAEGEEWTGWHRLEKDLWPVDAADPAYAPPLTAEERAEYADKLLADTQELYDRVHADGFTVTADQVGNGAKELLDEVATGKVTGEEEFWSHTDLWDFAANVDGARVAFGVLEPVVEQSDPDLVDELHERFDALDALLAAQGSFDAGFTLYTDLTEDQVRELADAVDALSEPLSQLTAAAVL
jgi:iron uptake system component EfeO